MERVEITIIGAGVMGLALAAKLSRPDRLVAAGPELFVFTS